MNGLCNALQVFDSRAFALGGANSSRFVPVPSAGGAAPHGGQGAANGAPPVSHLNGRSDGRFAGGLRSDRCDDAPDHACPAVPRR